MITQNVEDQDSGRKPKASDLSSEGNCDGKPFQDFDIGPNLPMTPPLITHITLIASH